MNSFRMPVLFAALALSTGALALAQTTAPTATAVPKPEAILHPADLSTIVPPSVYFQGQIAPTQIRNASAVRFADGSYASFVLVDSSGYSSSVREKYQAYILTDVPLEIDGHHLAPGAYGCGFLANDAFVVMDIGGHDLFTAHSTHDATLHRPTPLQVLAAESASHYRLYSGRNYVAFNRAN